MNGWFAMSRAMFDHPIFAGKPERVAAWAWILATAAWRDTRQDAGGKTVTVKRGQVLTSYRQMSRATGVSVKSLRTLIGRLQDEDAIGTEKGTGRLLITIRNYDKYQSAVSERAQTGAQEGHRKGTQNEQGNNSAKADAEKTAPDPVKHLFDSGIRILGQAGLSQGKARALIGKWRKGHDDSEVISAIGKAQREGAVDPVSFIEGCFRHQAKAAEPQIGETRVTPAGKRQEFVGGGMGWATVHD